MTNHYGKSDVVNFHALFLLCHFLRKHYSNSRKWDFNIHTKTANVKEAHQLHAKIYILSTKKVSKTRSNSRRFFKQHKQKIIEKKGVTHILQLNSVANIKKCQN